LGSILLAQSAQRFCQERHRPSGIKHFFCSQKFDRLHLVPFCSVVCVQLYEFLASSSFKAPGTVGRVRKVVLERGEQKRSEFSFEPVDVGECPLLQQVQEKTLGQVLGVIRRVPAASSEHVEWIPVIAAQIS